MSAVAQMFLHLTFSCPALREAVVSVVSPNLPSVLLEEEEEAEEEGRRRRRSSVAASDAFPEGSSGRPTASDAARTECFGPSLSDLNHTSGSG